MEVILKEDVDTLGHRGDVVKVADGYGRNFLLPKKLAIEATAANRNVIEQMKQSAVRRSAKERADAQQQVAQMELVSWFEERLSVRIPDEELSKIRSISDLRDVLARLLPPGTQIAA